MYAVILDYSLILGVFDTSEKAYRARDKVDRKMHQKHKIIVRPVAKNDIDWFRLGLDE